MWLIEQRRAEGISRAALVLAREGLAGTPALVLAEAMYCSLGGLYRGHGSKVGVARAVLRYADAALCHQLDQASFVSDGPVGYRDALRSVWRAAIEYSESDPDLFAYAQLHWRHPKGTEAGVEGAGGQTAAFLQELLTKGMGSGQLRTLPVEMVRALLWGTLVQLVKDRAAGLPTAPDEAFETVWRAIAASNDGKSSPVPVLT